MRGLNIFIGERVNCNIIIVMSLWFLCVDNVFL